MNIIFEGIRRIQFEIPTWLKLRWHRVECEGLNKCQMGVTFKKEDAGHPRSSSLRRASAVVICMFLDNCPLYQLHLFDPCPQERQATLRRFTDSLLGIVGHVGLGSLCAKHATHSSALHKDLSI